MFPLGNPLTLELNVIEEFVDGLYIRQYLSVAGVIVWPRLVVVFASVTAVELAVIVPSIMCPA